MESRSIFSPPRSMAANDLRNNAPMSPQAPACVQNAMFSKERKPFTYTPGGLDLSEIRSEKMAKRLMRNAMSPGVQEKPKAPAFTPPIDPSAPKSCHYFNLPVAVFPCIQIPANPKELLRRTSGPYSRSESLEPSTPNTPIVIENKYNGKIVEGHIKIKLKPAEKKEDVKKNEEVKQLENVKNVQKEDVSSKVETKENLTNGISPAEVESVNSSIDDRLELKINGSSESTIEPNNEISKYVCDVPKLEDVPKYNDVPKDNNIVIDEKSDVLEYHDDAFQTQNSNVGCKNNTPEQSSEIECKNEISEYEEDLEKKNDVSVNKDEDEEYEDAIPEYKITLPELKNDVIEYNNCPQENKVNVEECQSNVLECKNDVHGYKTSVPENENIPEYKSIEPDYENIVPEYNNVVPEFKSTTFDYANNEVSKDTNTAAENLPTKCETITNEESPISVETSESILNPLLEIIENELEKCAEESSHKRENYQLNENGFPIIKESPNMLSVECNRLNDSPREEERVISPMRRSMETIKGLSDDLDNLPSLNICTKRFSFLRDSPEKDYQKEEDDPFRILTGIPPKISLIDRPNNNYRNYDRQPPWKAEKEKPVQKENQSDAKSLSAPWKDDLRAPSPFTKEDGFWKKGWNSLSRKDSLTIKDVLKDDPEPAWKKEIREIALRKAKEETKEYANLQPKELPIDNKEYLQPIKDLVGEEPKYLISEPATYQPPWSVPNSNYYKPANDYERPNPTWSQTLRPKTWKEREAERKQNEFSIQPMKSVTNNFIKNQNGYGSPVRRTPEITVEVVNQPAYVSQPVPNNSYIYPWETSSESSTAFSPEPRTPTPQSRNSPFNGGYVQSAVSREYGTLGFLPKRRLPGRSCPIQSRSFKYLQLLTGTEDSYEDDEPFIPQPPQHAHPRPGNL